MALSHSRSVKVGKIKLPANPWISILTKADIFRTDPDPLKGALDTINRKAITIYEPVMTFLF